MCAQAKGYVLGKDAAILCLHIVHQLASVPVRDELPWENAPSDTAGEGRMTATWFGLAACTWVKLQPLGSDVCTYTDKPDRHL